MGGPLRGLLPHLATDGLDEAPLLFHALGLAEWVLGKRLHQSECL